jgi:ubiquinone/menaquinone biosynthesis C-methylase UbiE
MDKIKKHYKKLAKEFGRSKKMSMMDVNTKDLEVDEIIKYLGILACHFTDPKILEIGCGNGYTAAKINKAFNVELTGIDFCKDLIKIARKRGLKNTEFKAGNVLQIPFPDETFEIIFTERCLINLESWEKQKRALSEIHRVLKNGGVYIMIEAFTDGLRDLNAARSALGLEPIGQPFHNKYIEKARFVSFMKGRFKLFSEKHQEYAPKLRTNFLSSYYFGSRVVYPALAADLPVKHNNKFVEFFKFMEPYGNYAYIQAFVLEKI